MNKIAYLEEDWTLYNDDDTTKTLFECERWNVKMSLNSSQHQYRTGNTKVGQLHAKMMTNKQTKCMVDYNGR